LCEKLLNQPETSTSPLLYHLATNHPTAFDLMRVKLANPDQPETLDPANPIAEFFTFSNNKLAQCNHCLEIIGIEGSVATNLSYHLSFAHPDRHAIYEARCSQWQRQRKEEYLAYQRSQEKGTNPVEQIWNYFDKTADKYIVMCMLCKVAVRFSEESLVELNQHIEQSHPDIYPQFLVETTGIRLKLGSDSSRNTCPVCQKVLSSRHSMLDHIKIVHNRVHPFQCHVCGRTFARHEAYLSHKHIALKSYLCSHCGKQFTTRQGRKKHEQTHVTQNPAELATEICTFCGKAFRFKENRLRHEKIHTGEKPFQCSHCDKTFSQKQHLQTHLRTHTGKKHYFVTR
jgi:uncharacterized Zn-finger protein